MSGHKGRGDKGIYVERHICGSVEEVWRLTQTPEVHQRWDLRFTEIRYLPRGEGEPQRFLYATRLLPGVAVTGTGESVGERAGKNGEASSALKFASENPWSLIREGSGYWRYVPVADGVRFLTWYDYDIRFKALGRGLDLLFKPLMGWAFGLTAEGGCAALGRGVMSELWHGAAYTLPFLYVGAWRSIMFPEKGKEVPFTIENYAYRDALGRETMTWVRTFETKRRRRFDAYMIWSESRGRIVDYLGTHQHLAVDLDVSVAENGGLRLRSGEQRFYEGPVSFRFPMFFSGVAEVCEWYDAAECFRIKVHVGNERWGPLFGYTGSFKVEWLKVAAGDVPQRLLPQRVEGRA